MGSTSAPRRRTRVKRGIYRQANGTLGQPSPAAGPWTHLPLGSKRSRPISTMNLVSVSPVFPTISRR